MLIQGSFRGCDALHRLTELPLIDFGCWLLHNFL
jgi:hypothetical protein